MVPSARQCRLKVEPKLLTQEAQNPRKSKGESSTWTILGLQLVGWGKSLLGLLYFRVSQRYYTPVSFGCMLIRLQYKVYRAEIRLAAETRDLTLLMVQILCK